MLRSFLSFTLVFNLPVVALAQPLDHAKLRAAVYMPRTQLLIGTRAVGRDERGRKIDVPKKIAELNKQLRGDIEDAEIYLKIVALHSAENKEASANALAKATALLQPHLETKDPKQGFLIALYADCLAKESPPNFQAAEQWARRATVVAPEDWRCWTRLGTYLLRAANKSLGDEVKMTNHGADLHFNVEFPASTAPPALPAPRVRLSAEVARKIEQRLNEASQCYERARRLALDDPKMLIQCCEFANEEAPIRMLWRESQGGTVLPDAMTPMMQAVDIHIAAARRNPESVELQAIAANGIIMSLYIRYPVKDKVILQSLIAERAPEFKWHVDRLREAANHADREVAAFAEAMLFLVNMMLGKDEMVEHARRAYEKDPELENAADAYLDVLRSKEQWLQIADVTLAKLRTIPSARNYYFAALAQWELQRDAEVERLLRRGLEVEPSHQLCLLSLAAQLLRHSDRAGALDEAGKCLDKVRPLLSLQNQTPAFRKDFTCIDAIWHAMRGDNLQEARKAMQALAAQDADPESWRKLADAFGFEIRKETINKEKLRAAVASPILPLHMFVKLGDNEDCHGIPIDSAKEIDALHKQLRGQPEDALILRKIAALHARNNAMEAEKPFAVKAAAMFPSLLAKDADNLLWQTEYAWALLVAGEADRADQAIVKIAARASKDWRVWQSLGNYANRRIAAHFHVGLKWDAGLQTVMHRLANQAVVSKEVALRVQLIENWNTFAKVCMENALHLAPDDPDARLSHLLQIGGEQLNIQIIQLARGESNTPVGTVQLARGEHSSPITAKSAQQRSLEDLQHLCRLCPDNPSYWGVRAWTVYVQKAAMPDWSNEIEACLAALERLAHDKTGFIQGKSHLCAAHCCYILGRRQPGLLHAQKTLELLPKDEVAWNTLFGFLKESGRLAEGRDILLKKSQLFPSAVNHCIAGTQSFQLKDLGQAEKCFRAGLQLEENDVNCLLGLAAVHLAQGDRAELIAQADKLVTRAGALLGEQKHPTFSLLRGILQGLQGEALLCELYLREAQQLDPSSVNAQAALAALAK